MFSFNPFGERSQVINKKMQRFVDALKSLENTSSFNSIGDNTIAFKAGEMNLFLEYLEGVNAVRLSWVAQLDDDQEESLSQHLNEFNLATLDSKVVIDENMLLISSVDVGDFGKEEFGTVLTCFVSDVSRVISGDNFVDSIKQ